MIQIAAKIAEAEAGLSRSSSLTPLQEKPMDAELVCTRGDLVAYYNRWLDTAERGITRLPEAAPRRELHAASASVLCELGDDRCAALMQQPAREPVHSTQSIPQADPTTTRRFGGTRLGLEISRQIVEQMGGWIKADSLVDIGSQFTFQVPLGIDQTVPAAIFEPSEQIRRLHSLTVDDNIAALHIISEIFRRWGMRVDTVGSGLEARDMAVRKARAGRAYDLLLIDWNMPDIDGLQTVRDTRACPGIAVPPQVVVMTAHDVSELIQATLSITFAAISASPSPPTVCCGRLKA